MRSTRKPICLAVVLSVVVSVVVAVAFASVESESNDGDVTRQELLDRFGYVFVWISFFLTTPLAPCSKRRGTTLRASPGQRSPE